MSKTPIKVLRKKHFSSSDDSNLQNLMRRTRSNTIADLSPKYSRRSLRSGRSDKFLEIPNVFRSRTPHVVPTAAKDKTPRRSSRFANSENKVEHEDQSVCWSRKRRFQSCPVSRSSPTNSHGSPSKEVNGRDAEPVSKKTLFEAENHCEAKSDICLMTVSPVANGVYRKKITDLELDRRDEVGSDIFVYNSIFNGSSETVTKDDDSPTERPRASVEADPATKCTKTGCNNQEDNQEESSVHSVAHVFESNCTCSVTQCRITNEKSESCEKTCLMTRPNHYSVKSPVAESVVSLANGIRSTRQNFSSLRLSPAGASSPKTAEEATSKFSSNIKVNSSSSPHLRRSRRLSEKCDFSTAHDTEASSTTSKRTNLNRYEDLTESDTSTIKEEAINIDCSTKIHVVEKNNSVMIPEHCSQEQSCNDTNEVSVKMSENEEKEDSKKVPTAGKNSTGLHKHSLVVEDAHTYDSIEYAGFSDDDADFSYLDRKKRKMNLRSSGVLCDPDFYTLSLDLMIKRTHRKNLLEADAFAENHRSQVDDTQAVQDSPSKETLETDTQQEVSKFEDNVSQIPILDSKDEKNEIHKLFTAVTPKLTSTSSKDAGSGTDKTFLNLDKNKQLVSGTDTQNLPKASTEQGTLKRHTLIGLPKVLPKGKNRGPKGLVSSKLEKSLLSGSRSSLVSDRIEPPPLYTEDPPSGPDVYYFESDHVALKHNQDYHNLLHAVAKLEAQQFQILKDIEALDAEKLRAIDEPITFVKKLQKNEKLDFPHSVDIPDLPTIDWSKYTSVYGTFGHVFSNDCASPKKPVTRKKKINFETGVPRLSSNSSSSKSSSKGKMDSSSSSEANRSNTFKVAWTCEEQNKLEELLMKYPTEEIEFNRYRKIAAALGNRTPLQVQSRVQKYFLKLAKAGLPIPGRMPRIDRIIASRNKKARPHPHQSLTRMSTFFPTFHVPVRMKEDGQDDDRLASSSNFEDDGDGWTIGQDQVSDEEDIDEEMRYSDEYLEILRLKRMRREKLRLFDQNGQQALAKHIGFECDMCNCDPIEGVRYHCIDCPTEDGVDLCQSCIRCQGQFETETHKRSHRLEPIYKADNFTDNDYMRFLSLSGEYNYLDPNFLPPAT